MKKNICSVCIHFLAHHYIVGAGIYKSECGICTKNRLNEHKGINDTCPNFAEKKTNINIEAIKNDLLMMSKRIERISKFLDNNSTTS